MKKFVFVLLTLFAVLTACEGPMGPPGRDGDDAVGRWAVEFYPVKQSQWRSLGNGEYECVFDLPSVPDFDFVYNDGAILAYYMQDFDTQDEKQIGLPHIFFGADASSDYTAAYTYDVMLDRTIAFKVAYSDFTNSTPPACTFRVVLIW